MEFTVLQLALAGAFLLSVGLWFGWWAKHRQHSTKRAMLDELWTRKLKSYEQALEQAQSADIHGSTRLQGVQRELIAVRAELNEAADRSARLGAHVGELEHELDQRTCRIADLEQSRERIGRELVIARRELGTTRETLEQRERRLAALERLPDRLDEREAELAELERRLREVSQAKDTEIARLQEWVDDLTHLPSALERREAELRQSAERLGVIETDTERRVEQLRAVLGDRETAQKKLEQRLGRLRDEQEQDRRRMVAAREELEQVRARARDLAERNRALEQRLADEAAARAAALENERSFSAERSREYERSVTDLGREYERTLAERCDEYERWIATRENEHAAELAAHGDRAHGELVATAGEYERVLATEHVAHTRRFTNLEAHAHAGLGAAEAAAAFEREQLLAAAEAGLAEARATADAALAEARAAAEREVSEARAAAERDLEAALSLAERELAEARATAERELAEARIAAENELVSARAAAGAEVGEARAAAEAELERLRAAGEEEQQRLVALAAEDVAQAEARVAEARASLDAESARAAALEQDLHATALEYESTLAKLFVTDVRRAPMLVGEHEPLASARILIPGNVLNEPEAQLGAVDAKEVSPSRKKSSRASKGRAKTRDEISAVAEAQVDANEASLVDADAAPVDAARDDFGLLFEAPTVEFDAAATPYDLELARERSAALHAGHAAETPARPEAEPSPKRKRERRSKRSVAAAKVEVAPEPDALLAETNAPPPALEDVGEPKEVAVVAGIEEATNAAVEPEGTPAIELAVEATAKQEQVDEPTVETPVEAVAEPTTTPAEVAQVDDVEAAAATTRRMRARPRRERERVLRPMPPPSLPAPLAADKPPERAPEPEPESLRQAELVPHPPPAGATHRTSPRDELMRVRGIGPKLAERLVAVGCDSLHELANLGESRVDELARELAIPPARIRRERWIELAQALLADAERS